jgi:AcrR family transcriptional regulator
MPPRGRNRARPRRSPDGSRAAILQAAIREFARNGIAKVNQALLYYYFRDKDTLYGAALERVFEERLEILAPVLKEDVPSREKVLRYAGALFDYLAEHPAHREMVQREILVAPRHPETRRVLKRHFKPLFEGLSRVIEEGIASGDFRPVDPMHFNLSMGAVVVQYFATAPLMKLLARRDPLTAARLEARRAAVLDFIAAALFRPAPGGRKGVRS